MPPQENVYRLNSASDMLATILNITSTITVYIRRLFLYKSVGRNWTKSDHLKGLEDTSNHDIAKEYESSEDEPA
jgi:hypothetical protein